MSKHTPGPWYQDGDSIFRDIGDHAYHVATAEGWGEETAPNARLIAAAPDMLAALEAMLHDDDHDAACAKARAAISKATGADAQEVQR